MRLQALARGDKGYLLGLAYSSQRGYGRTHPFVGELRIGHVRVSAHLPELGFEVEFAEILLEADMDVERYRILEAVVEMEPRILDDMVRHARDQRPQKINLLNAPEDFEDYRNLLDGVVSYEVTRDLYRSAQERMRPQRGQAGSSMMPGMLQ